MKPQVFLLGMQYDTNLPAMIGAAGLPVAICVQNLHTNLSHVRLLEAESIYIIREVAVEFSRPVMLYSIGKDSSVILRLARKGILPSENPVSSLAHRY